jgi:hypothetical protein
VAGDAAGVLAESPGDRDRKVDPGDPGCEESGLVRTERRDQEPGGGDPVENVAGVGMNGDLGTDAVHEQDQNARVPDASDG